MKHQHQGISTSTDLMDTSIRLFGVTKELDPTQETNSKELSKGIEREKERERVKQNTSSPKNFQTDNFL